MSIADSLTSLLNAGDQLIWYFAFLVILPLSVYFTIKHKGVQITKFRESAKLAFDNKETKDSKSMSSFEAFMMGLGERIGLGNIVIVAAAIMVGGPGAIFWMWIFAALVAAFSFAETTVSQVYKTKTDDGIYVGGPAHTVAKGYGREKASKGVAVLYVITILSFALALSALFSQQFVTITPKENTEIWMTVGFAVLLSVILLFSYKAVARMNSIVVPVMSLGWIVLCVAVIIANWSNLGNAFAMIFHYAFVIPEELTQYGFLSIEGVWEGFRGPIGALLGTVVITGLRRGLYSNNSGDGTVSILSSMAKVKHPVRQGYVQCFGVFIDTMVICTCTALVILSFGDFSEIYDLGLNYAPLVTEIMSQSLLGDSARHIVLLFMIIFTATTFVSLLTMIESMAFAINNKKRMATALKIVFIVFTFLACFVNVDVVVYLSDILLAFCMFTNLTIIFGKRKVLKETYDDYLRQRKEGVKEPEFHKDALSDQTGVTEWG